MATPSNFKECIDEIVDAADGKISVKTTLDLLDRVEGRANRLMREQGLTPRDATLQASKDLGAEALAALKVEERNRLLNLQKRVARRANIEQAAAALGKGGTKDFAKALRNQVVAIFTPIHGGRFSAEAAWKARAGEYLGGLSTQLQNAGLLRAFRDGTLEPEWARELWELSKGAGGKPGVSKSPEALQIAQAIHGFQSLAKERLNREGAWIGDLPGYVTRQTHDPDRLRRAGYDDWRTAIKRGLDVRTFDGVDDPEKFLKGVYSALVSGVHLSDAGGVGFKDPAFSGPGNLAKSVSAERVLHFSSADTWLEYQRRFGQGSLNEQIVHALDSSARQEALLSRWGTNPAAEFAGDIKALSEKFRDTDLDATAKLKDQEKSLTTLFSHLDGTANMPANRMFARFGADLRTIESMAKLGGVAFSHISSGVTKAAELRYHGVGFFERWGDFLGSMLQGRGQGEMRNLADLMHAGTEGYHGSLLGRFSPDDTVAGTLSKAATRFFKLTGLTYLLDAQKAGSMRVMSRHLGNLVDTDHAALPAEVQRSLQLYGISPQEWDALRQAPNHFTMPDGRTFLTPQAAQNADAGTLEAMLRNRPAVGPAGLQPLLQAIGGIAPNADAATIARKVAAYRDLLGLKVDALFSDIADRSIVTPGIAERSAVNFATAPGSIPGEAMRFMAQFKLWGYSALRQGIGRETLGGQTSGAAASGIAQMAVSTALLGYVAMTLKGLARGVTPRPPNDPKTWMAAMIQGGGFGIMGDYLFGEYSRAGGSFGESLLGPVLGGGASEIMTLWNDIKGATDEQGVTRARKDVGPDLLKFVKDNTPFVNLFYTRMALDYLFLHSVQESMNPGYLARYQRRVEKQTGQQFLLAPTTHLRTFGR